MYIHIYTTNPDPIDPWFLISSLLGVDVEKVYKRGRVEKRELVTEDVMYSTVSHTVLYINIAISKTMASRNRNTTRSNRTTGRRLPLPLFLLLLQPVTSSGTFHLPLLSLPLPLAFPLCGYFTPLTERLHDPSIGHHQPLSAGRVLRFAVFGRDDVFLGFGVHGAVEGFGDPVAGIAEYAEGTWRNKSFSEGKEEEERG